MKKKQSLYFLIKNNTTGTIPVTLLNAGSPNSTVINAITRYAWDITGITYLPLTFSLQAKFSPTDSFVSYGGNLAAGNANALIAALNNLNIGSFWLETSGPNTYVVTWNDKIIYFNLIVGSATPATTTLDWGNYTLLAGGNLQIDVNFINVVNNPNPGTSTGQITALTNGIAVTVNVLASALEITPLDISRTLIYPPFTNEVLYNTNVPAGTPDSYSFNIDTNYTYTVNWGTPP